MRLDALKKVGACSQARRWFEKNFGESAPTAKVFITAFEQTLGGWVSWYALHIGGVYPLSGPTEVDTTSALRPQILDLLVAHAPVALKGDARLLKKVLPLLERMRTKPLTETSKNFVNRRALANSEDSHFFDAMYAVQMVWQYNDIADFSWAIEELISAGVKISKIKPVLKLLAASLAPIEQRVVRELKKGKA